MEWGALWRLNCEGEFGRPISMRGNLEGPLACLGYLFED